MRGGDLPQEGETNTDLEEINCFQNQLCRKLESSSIQTKMKFSQMNSSSGLFPYIGQMGLNNVHKILMNGCGMTVRKDMISLEWKTFEQNLMRSTITLADIVNFSKFVGIKRISIKFNKETHDAIERHYGRNWQNLLVTFAERILQRRFTHQDREMLTYHVCMNGKPGKAVKHAINKTGRKLFLNNFRDHSEDYSALDARLRTYRNWPYSSQVKPIDLASAGFIYSGHEDTVTCFSCNQSLFGQMDISKLGFGLKSSDTSGFDLILNHLYWNDNCAFLKSRPDYEQLKRMINALRATNFSDDEDGFLFANCATRFSTFDKDLPKLACLEFARAGFYQMVNEKENLSVVCYCCGIKINSVRLSQDPWIEHIRWNRNCKHVMDKKGNGFIKGVLHALRTDGESPDDVFAEVIIETFIMKRAREEDAEEEDRQWKRKRAIKMEDFELD